MAKSSNISGSAASVSDYKAFLNRIFIFHVKNEKKPDYYFLLFGSE